MGKVLIRFFDLGTCVTGVEQGTASICCTAGCVSAVAAAVVAVMCYVMNYRNIRTFLFWLFFHHHLFFEHVFCFVRWILESLAASDENLFAIAFINKLN